MIVFTIPLFIFLLMSSGHIYGYPSESFYGVITNHGHNLKVFRRPQMVNNNNHYRLTLNTNNGDQSYIYHPHKRLIDF